MTCTGVEDAMTMLHSFGLLQKVVDSLPDHIAVLDSDGRIVFTNHAWNRFGAENCCQESGWKGVNYLETCEKAARTDEEFAKPAATGIAKVISGEACFQLEYPCHSPSEKRWFMMNVVGLEHGGSRYVAISHVVGEADAALYRAKQGGRNRIEFSK